MKNWLSQKLIIAAVVATFLLGIIYLFYGWESVQSVLLTVAFLSSGAGFILGFIYCLVWVIRKAWHR